MPRSRFYNLPKEKRVKILDAAAKEFARHGFQETSYNQIIERAGVSKEAMYYYFEDKEDLFFTVVQEAIGRMVVFVADFPKVENPEQFLAELEKRIRAVGEFAMENRRDVDLMRGLLRADQDAFQLQVLKDIRTQSKALSERIFKIGQKVGAVRSDLPLGFLMSIVEAQDETVDKLMAAREETATQKGLEQWISFAQDLMIRIVLEPSILASRYAN